MKRTALFLLPGLLALGTASAQSGCFANVKKNGLTVVTSPDYPPFESLDASNKVVGFDIDLLNAVAKQMGVKVNLVTQSFDGLIPSLLAKKADLIAAGMTVTEERKKSVLFSVPYISGPNAIVTRKDTPGIRKLGDLAGKTVAVQLGTAQEKLVSGVKGANVKSFNLYTDAAMAVQTRQAQAMVLHKVVANSFVKVYPDLKIAGTLGSLDTSFAMRKECGDLQNRVNAALIQVRKSGDMDKLVAKWFK